MRGRTPMLTVLGAALVATSGAACGSGAGGSPARSTMAPPPLATSVHTSGGTWATVAMGNLQDPSNTFWQLFYRPAGSARWVDDVGPTAVATNGGLVAAASGPRLVVGTLPVANLTFSPLIQTADGGASWSDGLLPGGLPAVADAMALAGNGSALALVATGARTEVDSTSSGLSDWKPLVTERALAAAPAASPCRLAALTAVAWSAITPVVGAACSGPGQSGVFEASGSGGWRAAGPPVSGTSAQVVGLQGNGAGVTALVETDSGTGTSLVAAWSDPALRTWLEVPPSAVPAADSLSSVVMAPNRDVLVLLSDGQGHLTLRSADPASLVWRTQPDPPAGTATVAALADGTLSALSVSGSTLNAFDLAPGATAWARVQTLKVPIMYGSSS